MGLGGASGRVRVIADLAMPPLAAASGRGLFSAGGHRRLQVHSTASQAYLQRVARAQDHAVAELSRAIPDARVGRRFRILLDGLTVTLPAKELPALVRQSYVTHVYPSIQYTLALDHSPSVIGADVLHQTSGADGTGVKIGVVDDGIDQTNSFFNPASFSYPAGFPKGDSKYVTPKVIVAKVFPGPNSGAPGKLPLDPKSSFHGTHVAGIAAGDSGTTAPAGSDHPEVTGLSGVAPRAWLGNYRVFTVPTPIGHVANTPEIIAAFEAAVADGMDVINFSGGGPQVEPGNDALIQAIHNVAAAGVVPVIAAGNDRDDFGTGSAGSPGTAPDAISVAAVSNTHVFSPALDVTAPGAPDILKGIPFLGADGIAAPASWGSQNQTLVDAGSIVGTDGKPVERHLCGAGSDLTSTKGTLPAHSLDGKIVLAQRGLCPFVTKADQARAAGAVGIILSDNRQGEANGIPVQMVIPGGMIANLDGDHLRAAMAATRRADEHPRRPRSARARDGPERRDHELLVGGPDGVRTRLEARRLGARRTDPVVDAPEHQRVAVRRVRRHLDGDAARRRRGRAPAAAPPRLDAAGGQVRARLHRRPGLGRHGTDAGGAGDARGRRPRRAAGRRRPARLHRPRLALVPGRERARRRRQQRAARPDRGRGRRSRHLVGRAPVAGRDRRRVDRHPRHGRDRARRRGRSLRRREGRPPAPSRARTTASSSSTRARSRAASRTSSSSTSPRSRRRPCCR